MSNKLSEWSRRACTRLHACLAVALTALLLVSMAEAQDAKQPTSAEDSASKLAKETQNPVANLISVPFQNNFNFDAGSKNKMVWNLNVQPVIPIPITEDMNLITRTIIPIINQPSLFPGTDSAFGMGDINPTVFLSPAKPSKLIWGVGPTMTLRTASTGLLGSGRWSAGPVAVALSWTARGWSVRSPTSSGTSPVGATSMSQRVPHAAVPGDGRVRATSRATAPAVGPLLCRLHAGPRLHGDVIQGRGRDEHAETGMDRNKTNEKS